MNGWVIDGLSEGMADGSVDGSGIGWMEKMKALAAGLPKSLLSSCFLDFDQVLFAIFIGEDLVSNDQTHFLRCEQ